MTVEYVMVVMGLKIVQENVAAMQTLMLAVHAMEKLQIQMNVYRKATAYHYQT